MMRLVSIWVWTYMFWNVVAYLFQLTWPITWSAYSVFIKPSQSRQKIHAKSYVLYKHFLPFRYAEHPHRIILIAMLNFLLVVISTEHHRRIYIYNLLNFVVALRSAGHSPPHPEWDPGSAHVSEDARWWQEHRSAAEQPQGSRYHKFLPGQRHGQRQPLLIQGGLSVLIKPNGDGIS